MPDAATDAWDDGFNNDLESILARAFGIEDGYKELNGLTLKIGIDLYNDLGGSNSPMRVVISSLRARVTGDGAQRNMLQTLFTQLPGNFELRRWIEGKVPDMLPLVAEADFQAARAAYEADRLERRVVGLRRDIETLAPNIHLSDADKQLAGELIDRLDELNGYKNIHDALHHVQMSVMGEFVRVSSDQIGEVDRAGSIDLQLQEMQLAIDRIRRQFVWLDATPAAEQSRDDVIGAIEDIATLLGGLDAKQPQTAETAASLLRAMLRQQMSLFDSRLVEASEQVPFTKFAQSIERLPQPAVAGVNGAANPVLLSNISNSFQDVGLRLNNRQRIHRLWQQVEATILNIEELLRGTGREVEIRFHWTNIKKLITDIATRSADHDVARMLTIPDLDLALSATTEDVRSKAFSDAFGKFVRFARVRFQRADNALLEDCSQIRNLQDPLKKLL